MVSSGGQTPEGSEEVRSDVMDFGREGRRHTGVRHILKGGRPGNNHLCLEETGGDPPYQTDSGGISPQGGPPNDPKTTLEAA